MAIPALRTDAGRLHVAVVGAGVFGGWTALHLQRMGARVTLIDAWGPGNSRSSSGGESRIIRCIYGRDRIYVQWTARSLELWRESQKAWGVSLYGETGVLWMFAQDDGYARASIPLAAEIGKEIHALERTEAERRFPGVSFEGIRNVYFEPEAGYLMARRACRAMLEQFEREGGRYLQAWVAPPTIRRGRAQPLELASRERLAADRYVFACGPWLGRMFPGTLSEYIRPTRQEVHFFGPPAGDRGFDPGQFPVWVDFGERRFYGFPNIDQRGVKIADDTRGEELDPVGGDRMPSTAGVERARAFLAQRFPSLASAPLLETRVCQYENSPDGHLIVDRHPDSDRIWLAGGGSGHGFKMGPAVGEHVARRILQDAAPEPMFSFQRLAGLQAVAGQFGSGAFGAE